MQARESRRSNLSNKLKERSKKADTKIKKAYADLVSAAVGVESLARPIDEIAHNRLSFGEERLSVLRILIDAATEREDLMALATLEASKDLSMVATNARKAMQEIDYSFFGPQVKE